MATTKNTKRQIVVVAQQLVVGTAKHLTSATPVALLGSSFTPAQITSELQSLVTLRADVDAGDVTGVVVTPVRAPVPTVPTPDLLRGTCCGLSS